MDIGLMTHKHINYIKENKRYINCSICQSIFNKICPLINTITCNLNPPE